MGEGYVLEWLDTLISVTLNPDKTNVELLHPQEIAFLRNHIDDEKNKVMLALKKMVFKMADKAKTKSAVKLYYSSLIVLLDQALKNQIQISKYPQLKQTSNILIACINEILLLIEGRFAYYLDPNERLPKTYFVSAKNELMTRIITIEKQLNNYPVLKPVADIMIQDLVSFFNYPSAEQSVTFQQIEYIKELCSELEHIEYSERDVIFSRLDELLFCMNFNSRHYLENLTQRLTVEINSDGKKEYKMERLLFYFKLLKQLPMKTGIIFDSTLPDLNKTICNWFLQEILYLEKKMHFSASPTDLHTQKVSTENPKQKVMCALSTDQTGLILRAADDLQILIAKSMSEVFKTIVPHLSTRYKKDLSYDGMRSKSYAAEDRDKQIAIKALQRIIKKIEEY